MKLFTCILVVLPMLLACIGQAQEAGDRYAVDAKVTVGNGPEDMVIDTLSVAPRLLISCSARREGEPNLHEIMQMDMATQAVNILSRTGEPTGLDFNPHGINLVKSDSGQLLLFVVNHAKQEDGSRQHSIIRYEVKGNELLFQKQFLDPGGAYIVSPNDVVGLPDGSCYFTNDSKHQGGFMLLMEKMFKTRASSIIYASETGYRKVAGRLAYANGIDIKDDYLYCATTFKKEFVRYRITLDHDLEKKEKIAGEKGMDNINFTGEHHALVPAHTAFMKFLKHAKDSTKKSPGVVYKINIQNGKTTAVFTDDGSTISAPTTAIFYKGKMYIAQVFDPFILVVKKSSAAAGMQPE